MKVFRSLVHIILQKRISRLPIGSREISLLFSVCLLLVQSQVNVYSASYRAAYHWVVSDAKEAHHFNVSRYGARTCKLSV